MRQATTFLYSQAANAAPGHEELAPITLSLSDCAIEYSACLRRLSRVFAMSTSLHAS